MPGDGLYYCQSRYYDAVVGRWLNADGLVTTGQGVLSFNMYAYCNNNWVNLSDPKGTFAFLAILAVVAVVAVVASLSGCSSKPAPTSNVGAAKPYNDIKGGSNTPNCYAYAVEESKASNPGDKSNTTIKVNEAKSVAKGVTKDLKKSNRSVRTVSGPDALVFEDEYKIALRVGTKPFGMYADGSYAYDYHFMVQTNTGQWAEKHGTGGDSVLWDFGMTPDNIPWTLGGQKYYDSEIIYFGISH
ncbi:MAG: hypothetical protein LBQ48_03490 [Oscillospiraceae bacterium]|nr:hypothetical protein [Oscillospiraceae bacterium]